MELIEQNDFMYYCGYAECEPYRNGGYGCSHTDCTDNEMIDNVEYGKCYPWSCPFATQADAEDLRNISIYADETGDEELNLICDENNYILIEKSLIENLNIPYTAFK